MSSPETVAQRQDYRHFVDITTRWMDNDVYGHVNNVAYYSFFDTAVNCYLIDRAGLDIHRSAVIGVVVESKCSYRRSAAYPDRLEAGLRVDRIGDSSVQYGIGIFREGEEEVSAWGHLVHVFVDRETRVPTSIPPAIRAALETIRA